MVDNCTLYSEDYDPDRPRPCQCPVCAGFLKWDENDEPVCNKCGADLVKVPDVDDDTKETMEWGKICAVSGRKHPPKKRVKRDSYVYSI